jgi:hypothetical protein
VIVSGNEEVDRGTCNKWLSIEKNLLHKKSINFTKVTTFKN